MAPQQVLQELTKVEIEELRTKLHICQVGAEVSWAERLRRVQKEIVEILKGSEVNEHIRFLIPRDDIKKDESIVEKINSRRRKGETCNIEDVDDLIGAKALCAYPSDVKTVLDWLYGRGRPFSMRPSRKEARRERQKKDDDRGYRAYHLRLQLKRGYRQMRRLPAGAEQDRFELQVNTLLEEAWDAKTHGVTYKGPEDLGPELKEHMKLVSHSFAALDDQTELLRYQILEEQMERERRRRIAIMLFMDMRLSDQEKNSFEIPIRKPPEQWGLEDVQRIKNKVDQASTTGVNRTLCLVATLLALQTRRSELTEEALSYANSLVTKRKRSADSLRTRALIRWALGAIQESLYDLDDNIRATNKPEDKNDYVYYICDLRNPRKEDVEKAQQFVNELETLEDKACIFDTLARWYIRFAEDIETIDKARKYAHRACQIAQTTEPHLEAVARAYEAYNEYLAVRQMVRLQKRLAIGKTARSRV